MIDEIPVTVGSEPLLPPVGGVMVRVLRAVAHHAEVDTAVAFAVLTKLWQIVNGLVTIVLVVRYLTPDLQGFFYTFGSLLGLQSFFELAFYLVIISAASHEWAHLNLTSDGHISGNPDALSRLVSLGRLSAKWYGVASVLFLLGVGAAGIVFFNSAPVHGASWRAPWVALVCSTSLLLFALPFNSILEGCNQVAMLQRFRFSQAVLSSIALWGALALGLSLWAAVAASLVSVGRDVFLLFGQYRNFFKPFFHPPAAQRLNWTTDIWPMQWRLALSGVVSFFAFSLFNPVMFHYHGAVVAGQMGMTWAMTTGVQAMALAWISTRVPRFGQMIARREWASLDAFWRRSSIVSITVAAVGGVVAFTFVYALNALHFRFATRLLPPLPTAVFLLCVVAMQISQCQTAYLRAHKQEPIVRMSFISSLATGVAVWVLGAHFGPLGAAIGYLAVLIVVVIWETAIWRRCRRDWHVEPQLQ